QPDRGKWIEQKARVRLEDSLLSVVRRVGQIPGTGPEPRVDDFLERYISVSGRPLRVLPHCAARPEERQDDNADTNRVHRRLLQLAAEEEHHRRAERRRQRNHPDVFEEHYEFSSCLAVSTWQLASGACL